MRSAIWQTSVKPRVAMDEANAMVINQRRFTWDDFLQFDIDRSRGAAEIIMAWLTKEDVAELGGASYEAEMYPVHLLGFQCDPSLSDYEIFERGFEHYERLIRLIESGR